MIFEEGGKDFIYKVTLTKISSLQTFANSSKNQQFFFKNMCSGFIFRPLTQLPVPIALICFG